MGPYIGNALLGIHVSLPNVAPDGGSRSSITVNGDNALARYVGVFYVQASDCICGSQESWCLAT